MLESLDRFLDPTLSVLELERRKGKEFNPINIDPMSATTNKTSSFSSDGASKEELINQKDP